MANVWLEYHKVSMPHSIMKNIPPDIKSSVSPPGDITELNATTWDMHQADSKLIGQIKTHCACNLTT